ncbi:hepatocyte cell adhesion molecule-like isoform X2 [Alosa sapidissima]|uniref:hepatocyte cell adhesion molecule-like isoform X2 n=1 Tax=Alosa sapidissima TaxID=34773 RepID=UPI001C081E5D|nr:hepatocyte cell adhesion molecule-like isoform X2 [Alosa sapidissima]
MKTVLGLLVLLAASTHAGLDSMCNATQNAACYGALGGPVYLQLMRNTTGRELTLRNGSDIIFRFRRSKPVFYNKFNTTSVLQRWQFVPDNGTMIINPAERRDGGTYRVEIIERLSGRGVGNHTVQLTIEAPVSDVDLSINCSANGERTVMCSSNGNSPQYSWSLDGRPLGETDADLSSDNQTLLLRGDVTGQLICSVRNHVSSTNTTRLMELCSERPVSVIYVSYFLVFILVCLCVAAWMFYVWRKRRNTHTPVKKGPDDVVYVQLTTNVRRRSDMRGVEAQEVVYSDVATANRRSRRKSRKPPAEAYELEYAEVSAYKRRAPADTHHTHTPAESVEYGEVRVHTHTTPSADTHTPTQHDNSVYAHVHPGQ